MTRSLYYRWCACKNIISTLRFNFHYFPISIAIKLPVVFYSPVKLRSMDGKIIINGDIKHSMISIGLPGNDLFSYSTHNIWVDQGGVIIFNDTFGTNPGASFVIRKGANLVFGGGSFGQNLKILCSKEIHIGNSLLASWNITIMDTDSHYFKNTETGNTSIFSQPIRIGDGCFIGNNTTILKGAKIANGAVVSSNAVVHGVLNIENALYAGVPAIIKKEILHY